MSACRNWGIACLLAGIGLAAQVQAGDDKGLPRYQFKVGQELAYRQESDFHYGTGDNKSAMGHKNDWTIWVIRKNDDGSFRLILRNDHKMWQVYGKDQRKSDRPSEVSLAYADVFPDGRITPNDSWGYTIDPVALFPRLPKDAAEAANGWHALNEKSGDTNRFTPGKSDGATFAIDLVRDSLFDKIYLSSNKGTLTFDRQKGLITKASVESTQGYGFNGKGVGTSELVSVKDADAAFLKQLTTEAERYFAASKTYEKLTQQAGKNAKDADALLEKSVAVLKDLKENTTLPLLKDQTENRLKGHAQMAKYIVSEAKNRDQIIGKPAAEWDTKDLDGKSHSLKGYLGKVVVMDFWYRGCGWCIKAMPQMNQLADDFKDQPVVILGMNTDQKEQDALFVVEQMKLTYPNLKAQGVPQKYKVQGFPTLIIIDQKGLVHDIHVGYTPNLRQDVGQVIRDLLAKKGE
ncbi:MAG: TlpA family protein disulfide reductase [Planctomycetes bacterium]|nr:TlpA family protein disulfide reductase [Planctomycetota bacterium]